MKIIILIVLCSFPGLLIAEAYKWVDENGVMHFSDKKPHSEALEIDISGQSRSNKDLNEKNEGELSREEKRQRLLDAMKEDREERKKKEEAALKKLKYKKERCAQLREALRKVRRAAGIYKLDEKGNRKFISIEQKNTAEKNIIKTINKHCR